MTGKKANTRIGVVGAGAFGTALACVLSGNGAPVPLIGRSTDRMMAMRKSRVNDRLPGTELPATIEPSTDLADLGSCDIVLLAVPSAAQIETARQVSPALESGCPLVMCAKGLDRETGEPIAGRLALAVPDHPVHVLSGPGFAVDIARGLPTAMTLASATLSQAEAVAAMLSKRTFRLYASQDLIGVQLCGALKNVLAIAAGIVIGAGLGESARAALIARGLAELTRFVVASGGLVETASGLAGLGDLVLTATSPQSRNYRFGCAIGAGEEHGDSKGTVRPLVEGAAAAIIASRVAQARSVPMPITDAVAGIVDGRIGVSAAVEQLLSRPLRIETA